MKITGVTVNKLDRYNKRLTVTFQLETRHDEDQAVALFLALEEKRTDITIQIGGTRDDL